MSLSFDIAGNSADFVQQAEQMQHAIIVISQEAEKQAGKVETSFGRMASSAETAGVSFGKWKNIFDKLGGTEALKKFVGEVVNVRAEFQQLELSFATLLQSKEEANTLMSQIMKTAATSPFSVAELGAGAKQLLAYGAQADEVNRALVQLGTLAAGVGAPLEQVVSLYGTILTQGSLSVSNLEQFASSGIPMLQELANMYGVTAEEVNRMVSAGRVGFPEVQAAIANLTDEGSRFYEVMQEQSQTITGKISSLKDAWEQMLNQIGESQEGVIGDSIDATKYLVENYESLSEVLLGLIATYGTYRAALAFNTVLDEGLKKGLWDKIKATKIAIVTQNAYNNVLKAGPWMAIAAAVVGLGYAIYKVYTAETELDKAHGRLNTANAEVEKSLSSEVSKLTALERKLVETKQGTEEYDKIKKTIVSNYGQYYKGLDEEIDRVGNLSTVYSKLVENMRLSIGQRKFESFFKSEQDNLDKVVSEKLDTAYETLIDKYGRSKGTDLYNQFFDSAMRGKALSPQVIKELKDATFWEMSWGDNAQNGVVDVENNVLNLRSLINKEMKATEAALAEYKAKFRITEEGAMNVLVGSVGGANNGMTEERKNLRQLVDDIKAAEQEVKSLREQSKEGLIDDKALEDAITKLNKLKKSYNLKMGENYGSSNPENALREQHARLQKLILSQDKEAARSIQDFLNEVQQIEIDSKPEGSEKILAQLRLNKDKAEQAIDREKEDWLQKKKDQAEARFNAVEDQKKTANPAYIKQTFDPSNIALSDKENKMFDQKYKASLDRQAAETQAYYDAQAQSMNDYLAAYGDYAQKRQAIIDRAEARKKGKNEWERKTIDEETEKALSDLDVEVNKKTAAFGRLFSDMKEKNVRSMRDIAATAQSALAFVQSGNWDEAKGKEFGISKETFAQLQKSPDEIARIEEGIRKMKKEADDCDTAFNKLAKGLHDLFASQGDSEKTKNALSDIERGLNEVVKTGKAYSSVLSDMGNALGSSAMGNVAEGIGTAMDTATSALAGAQAGAQAGAVFGPWGSAAGAAIGLVSSLGSSLAKLHDAKHEKSIQRIQNQIEVLEKTYDNLGRSVEKAYSSDASQMIAQQNTLLEQQKVLIGNQIKEEKDKKKTDWGRVKEWENQIEEINRVIGENKEKQIDAILGEDVKTAIDNFAQAYAAAWEAGEDRAQSSKEVVKNMIKQLITEAMKSAASKPMEALRRKMAELFADGIISSIDRRELEKQAEDIVNQLDRQFGWADQYMKGEEDPLGGADAEESSKGAFQSMSQETGEELNGRFTALQTSGEEIRNSLLLALGSLSTLCTTAADGNLLLSEMRNLAVISNSYLEDIARYTKPLLGVGEKLDKIERNTANL